MFLTGCVRLESSKSVALDNSCCRRASHGHLELGIPSTCKAAGAFRTTRDS